MAKLQLKRKVFTLDLENEKGEVVHTVVVDKTDKSVKDLQEKSQAILGKTKDLEQIKDFEEGKKLISEVVDDFLGDGTFKAIYGVTGSTFATLDYFVQIVKLLMEDISKDQKEVAKAKYLQ